MNLVKDSGKIRSTLENHPYRSGSWRLSAVEVSRRGL